jgi:hypothetical protein
MQTWINLSVCLAENLGRQRTTSFNNRTKSFRNRNYNTTQIDLLQEDVMRSVEYIPGQYSSQYCPRGRVKEAFDLQKPGKR